MSNARDHYDRLLGARYVWMHGPYIAKVEEQRALFERLRIEAGRDAPALDLGCGPGYQAIALAKLGYRVTAVDLNAHLLGELARERDGLPITAVRADLRDCLAVIPPGCALAVCMGDTLTHLESHDEVRALCRDLASGLVPGGRLILTWRDLGSELSGLDRFIPVRADGDRIMTCFLEYEADRVIVHDLFHEREGETWTLHKSSYAKLRLPLAWVVQEIEAAGFSIELAEAGRFATLAARRA